MVTAPSFEPPVAGSRTGLPIVRRDAGRGSLDHLFRAWQREGDERAREELLRRFLPLARRLAGRYGATREPRDDLVQVASLALVKAIDGFDLGRGHAFGTYATPTILGELRRHFRDTGWMLHVARTAQERAQEAERAIEVLSTGSGRTPTVEQLAHHLNWDVAAVLEALETAGAHYAASVDVPLYDGEEGSLLDTIGDEDPGFAFVEDQLAVRAVMRYLTDRERRLLHLRFIEELSQAQIAERFGLSQMQISRTLRSVLERVRALIDIDLQGAS